MPDRSFPLAAVLRCLLLVSLTVPVLGRSAAAAEPVGLRVPDGFEVTLYADDDLASDIYCLTIDSLGRVVVSGPGYVRILIDSNGDGKADTYRQFADGPASGAQGMHFHGRDLLCIGDAGLIRYRDADGDDRADGPPDVFLKMKTGGEHHVHAIRQGPDGWWYIIAGNFADINRAYATLPTSPIREPHNGVLMRLKPDLSGGEIVADGFRNPYDFDFNPQGDVFVYDSDGERDVSLPWYRPTRLFHTLPASHAGWITTSWKRPDEYADMPPVVASTGRGSPTGVVCYRHTQFPEPYRNALFILDWTFGRVLAVPPERDGATWRTAFGKKDEEKGTGTVEGRSANDESRGTTEPVPFSSQAAGEPIPFLTGVGQFGFAPTDAEVGPDGSLYVSVGGRGTRGGVYRVRWTGEAKTEGGRDGETEGPRDESPLILCLEAPQPLSSWSRARWEPVAHELGRRPFIEAALNEELAAEARLRAIEIVTELFGGLEAGALERLASDESPQVRARAVWSLGRIQTAAPDARLLLSYLNDTDPLVVRFALESLLGAEEQMNFEPLLPALARTLGHEDRVVRQTAARVMARLPQTARTKLEPLADKAGPQALLWFALGETLRSTEVNLSVVAAGLSVLEGNHSPAMKLEAVRLLQLASGDFGPGGSLPPVFHGYGSPLDLTPHQQVFGPARARLARCFPTRDPLLDFELARLLAMHGPDDPALFDRLLAKIHSESHPVDDIHFLAVAARLPVERDGRQRQTIASALLRLEPKILARQLNQDTNWETRVGEMYRELVARDADLPAAIVRQPGFGRPGHVMYLSEFREGDPQEVIAAFVAGIEKDREYPWTSDVVLLLGASDDPRHRELVRKQFENFSLRGAVLMVLAGQPESGDRPKFVAGLDSSQLEVLAACLQGLSKLPPDRAAAEQLALLRTLRRLGADQREFALREGVVRLLRRNTGQEFGFTFGPEGHRPQNEAIARWTAWIAETYPTEVARQPGSGQADMSQFRERLDAVAWEGGDPERGRRLFETRSCAQCHGGRRALGPDLAGIARRFSREDVFVAIVFPDRDVSPRYQTTLIQTTDGRVYTGLIIYESVDGLILRNAQNQTFRIEGRDIEDRRRLNSSLMPAALLDGLSPHDWADLYAYLQGLL